jgi:hypothetical protein
MSRRKKTGGDVLAYTPVIFLLLFAWLPAAFSHDDVSKSRRTVTTISSEDEKINELTEKITAFIEERCYGCHKSLDNDPLFDPQTKRIKSDQWDEVKRRIDLPDSDGEHMPPPSETALTKPQKDKIKEWIHFQGFVSNLTQSSGPDDLIEDQSHKTPSVTDVEAHRIMSRACGNCHGPAWTQSVLKIPVRAFHRTFLDDEGALSGSHLGEGVLPTTIGLLQSDVERGSMPLPEKMHRWVNSLMNGREDPLPPADRKKLLTWFKQLQTDKKPTRYSIVWKTDELPKAGSKKQAERACAAHNLHLLAKGQVSKLKDYFATLLKDAPKTCFWTSGFSGISDSPNAVWIVEEGRGYLWHRNDSASCSFVCGE